MKRSESELSEALTRAGTERMSVASWVKQLTVDGGLWAVDSRDSH